jgi:hypothetical protein
VSTAFLLRTFGRRSVFQTSATTSSRGCSHSDWPSSCAPSGCTTPELGTAYQYPEAANPVRRAAGVGFEPTGRLAAANGFQDRPVRPLRHPACGTGYLGQRQSLRVSTCSCRPVLGVKRRDHAAGVLDVQTRHLALVAEVGSLLIALTVRFKDIGALQTIPPRRPHAVSAPMRLVAGRSREQPL